MQTPGGEAAAIRLVWISIGLALAAVFASEVIARRLTARLTGRTGRQGNKK